MENPHGPHGNLMMLQKNTDGEITQELQEDDLILSTDQMRQRVSVLEKECSSMKQEIQKIGKPKNSWSLFSKKFGFGSKSQQQQ